MGDNRNLIIFGVIAMGIMLIYNQFVMAPAAEERRAAAEAERAAAEAAQSEVGEVVGGDFEFGEVATTFLPREQALERAERVEVRTPSLTGSISLTGARFDDIQLVNYESELGSGEPVTLLSPEGTEYGHYVAAGWLGNTGDILGVNSAWTLVEGNVLTPDTPIVIEARVDGLTFQRRISVDNDYLFTIDETVTNSGTSDVALRAYGVVRHEDFPIMDSNQFILHEGAVGATGGASFDVKFTQLEKDREREESSEGQGGWVGLTTKYWLAAITPDQDEQIEATFLTRDRSTVLFEANYRSEAVAVPAGSSITRTTHVYTGAKDQPLLVQYKDEYGIQRFDSAIDWGMFWFLTQPFFIALHFFYGLLGNYGLAIMVVTLAIKLVLFPLNNRAFASMAKMRGAAPKMQEIREKNKDNPQAQQQAMMELYRKEKINPLAGCLPILPQIPIFFALYKTVFISLDARHAPFFGWIQDMSAPDPTSMWNLFGAIPYDPSGLPIIGGILAIGAWPIVMGITMWAQQSLNPPPPDKIQRQIFAFLPIVFTIVLAPFAAALVIYWTWNNILTVAQQYFIMRRQGVTTELDKNLARVIARIKGKPAPVFEDANAPSKDDEKISDQSGDAKPANADEDTSAETAAEPVSDGGDSDDTPPPAKPTGGKRVSSNPAAKKKRGGAKKKK